MRMRIIFAGIICRFFTLGTLLLALPIFAQESDRIAALISAISYGVPKSPAFELLPERASEVTNIVTPHDASTNITNIFDGRRLRTGVAFDGRPFSFSVGSLQEYRANPLKQILWRTVLSFGTAPASNDVFCSAGLRLPLIDLGDSRANKKYVDRLEEAYANALAKLDRPRFDAPPEAFLQRSLQASKMTEPVRDSLAQAAWNALKVDAGVAFMLRAQSGDILPDSLGMNRWGIWVATGLPLWKIGQLTVCGKTSWISTDSSQQETDRRLLGARARFFITKSIAASIEGAKIWSIYQNRPELDESWNHFAALIELQVPVVGGWLGIVYGGDTSRREKPDAKLSFNYAVSMNRLIKK